MSDTSYLQQLFSNQKPDPWGKTSVPITSFMPEDLQSLISILNKSNTNAENPWLKMGPPIYKAATPPGASTPPGMATTGTVSPNAVAGPGGDYSLPGAMGEGPTGSMDTGSPTGQGNGFNNSNVFGGYQPPSAIWGGIKGGLETASALKGLGPLGLIAGLAKGIHSGTKQADINAQDIADISEAEGLNSPESMADALAAANQNALAEANPQGVVQGFMNSIYGSMTPWGNNDAGATGSGAGGYGGTAFGGEGGGPAASMGWGTGWGWGGMGGFAKGGRPPVGKPSIVGEEGPEMFVPDKAGTIMPHRMTEMMMKAGKPKKRRQSHGSL